MLIVSGIFEATPGNCLFMNEMRLSTGFMNDVTSLFVPKLCLDNHNKVTVANGPTHNKKKTVLAYITIKQCIMDIYIHVFYSDLATYKHF